METEGPNAEQIEYWNDQTGPKWVDLQPFIDAMLRPFGHAAMEGLGPLDGARVLDVGCGCGDTTLELAGRVGTAGEVLGVDLSAPMLERARQRAVEAAVERASFAQLDAQRDPMPERYDAVFSRFGVMFFADPVAAFANLRKAMRQGGRLSFICWQALDHNEWFLVPLRAALEHLPPPEPPEPDAPGPFAFADGSRVERILRDAGYSNVAAVAHDTEIAVGEGHSLDEVAEIVTRIGPTNRLLGDSSDDLRRRVVAAVRASLEPYFDGVARMRAAAWRVTATA